MNFLRFLKWTALPALIPVAIAVLVAVVVIVTGLGDNDAISAATGWLLFALVIPGPLVAAPLGSLRYSSDRPGSQRALLALGSLPIGLVIMWVSLLVLVTLAFNSMEFAAVG